MVQVLSVKFMLYVRDMPRAIAFYRDSFGGAVVEESPYWSELEIAGSVIALHYDDTMESGAETGLIFKVAHLSLACDVLRSKGCDIENTLNQTSEGIMLALCRDPDGNRFSVVQDLQS